ncbi:MAG: OmpA family protein [Candidatus Aminicenantes bacterium]|nr:OmpA family protein [Candidatus Aminicenantes bacterium]
MYKKIFVLLGILFLITGTYLRSGNDPQEPRKLRILSVYPRKLAVERVGLEKFANDLKKIANTQYDIEVYYNGEGEYKNIKPDDVFDEVSNGKVEMGFGTSPYWKGKEIPGNMFMCAVPFGMSAKDMYAWLYRGGGLELWREMYEPYGVIPFSIGDTVGAMGGWFKKEIKNIKDFRGMKIRTLAFDAKIYDRLGAEVHKEFSAFETLPAYDKGAIDAFILLGPYSDKKNNFHKGPKYYYYPGWQEPCGVISLIINKKTWDNLEDDVKKKIEIVCSNTYHYIYNLFDSMNSRDLQELKKEGVQIKEFPPEVLDKFRSLSTILLEEEANKSQLSAKIYRSFKKFKKENVDTEWRKILDKAVHYSDTTTQKLTSGLTAKKFIDGLAGSKVATAAAKGNNSVVITFSGAASFGSWKSKPTPALVSEIKSIVKMINDYSISIKWIKVEGHASTLGEDCSNWKISKNRANTVAKLLTDNGIDESLIKTIAYGEDYPLIYPDNTEGKRRINRRVELVIEY